MSPRARGIGGLVALAICFAWQDARPMQVCAAEPDRDYFAVDVQPLYDAFDASNIVSDPPIIEASFYQMDSTPIVAVPVAVEAYLLPPASPNNKYRGYRIVGTKPRSEAFSGKLFMIRRHPEQASQSVLGQFDFEVDAEPSERATREEFLRARGRHYERLWSAEIAGAAMFRHLARTSLGEIGETARSTGPKWPLRRRGGADSTIQLMSGGRAVSENLQLDARLNLAKASKNEWVPISEIRGIEIREIDWSTFLSDKPTELDPLASLVPHDQYAIFLPSFQALTEIVDRGGELSRPAAQWFEPQSRKTDVLAFYQQQLAMPLNALTRQVGGALIKEVVVTGSDPYFRTGTDVAVLMQSNQIDLLHQTVLAQVTATASQHPDARRVEHKVDDHLFTHWSTDDRRLSSYVARLDNAVVVSNSLHQMMQVLKCSDGRGKTMGELDEYRFFRQRYPRHSVNETALVVVTDAAIRRWCGPRWRITAGRRTRARATIAEVTAAHADQLVRGALDTPLRIPTASDMPDAGLMTVSNRGVVSEKYGTLAFQTPIAELDARFATSGEEAMYRRWRESYERRWRRNFDPIAIQLSVTDHSLRGDISVIPLILQSEYRSYTQWVGNLHIPPGSGDPHPEAMASYSMAFDINAPLMQIARMVINVGNTEYDPFAWINNSVHLYFDRDEAWMKKMAERSPWEANLGMWRRESPVALFIPSKDNLRLTAFMVALRATIERAAPNVIRWESADHNGFRYVVGTVVQDSFFGNANQMPQLYYVTTPKGLTFSSNRGVITRAIDRHLVKDKKAGEEANETEDEGLDEVESEATVQSDRDDSHPFKPQLAMQTSGQGAELMARVNYDTGLRRMNRIAWSNIPILNFLRRQYPDRDPRQVYKTLFGEEIVEPTGGTYEWNADRHTYVSTLHGYHLEPKAGPVIGDALGPRDQIRTALSFQNGGLRATVEIEQHQGE